MANKRPPQSVGELLRRYGDGERDFPGASLSEALLVGANLEGVDLRGATLIKAHLERAKLIRANLQGTRLEEANLDNVCMTKATYNSETTFPDGFDPDAHGMKKVLERKRIGLFVAIALIVYIATLKSSPESISALIIYFAFSTCLNILLFYMVFRIRYRPVFDRIKRSLLFRIAYDLYSVWARSTLKAKLLFIIGGIGGIAGAGGFGIGTSGGRSTLSLPSVTRVYKQKKDKHLEDRNFLKANSKESSFQSSILEKTNWEIAYSNIMYLNDPLLLHYISKMETVTQEGYSAKMHLADIVEEGRSLDSKCLLFQLLGNVDSSTQREVRRELIKFIAFLVNSEPTSSDSLVGPYAINIGVENETRIIEVASVSISAIAAIASVYQAVVMNSNRKKKRKASSGKQTYGAGGGSGDGDSGNDDDALSDEMQSIIFRYIAKRNKYDTETLRRILEIFDVLNNFQKKGGEIQLRGSREIIETDLELARLLERISEKNNAKS